MHISYPYINKSAQKAVKMVRSEMTLQAILVGVLAGFLAVLFQLAIEHLGSFVNSFYVNNHLGYKILFLPFVTALGGLFAGLIITFYAPDGGGSGIPLIKHTLSKLKSRIRIRSVIAKFFAGVLGIGSGLSLGREGPSVHLGAGAGAFVAKYFKNKGMRKKKLIAAGSGAALAATFNSPLAAAIFVFEELLHIFSSAMLFPVLIATVVASTIARLLLGNHFAFKLPETLTAVGYESIPVFIVLGVVAGVLGVMFSRNIQHNIEFFKKIKKIPAWLKPAVAGFVTGVVGVYLPLLLGPGNEAINNLFYGKLTLLMVFVLIIGKFFLTSFCFGSGAAGGLFLPTIMLGAFIGNFIGLSSKLMFGLEVDLIVVTLVGMGAFLSAVVRTPLTAVIIVFEMTGDYNHILPIMLSAAIADLIAERMHSPSIYEILMKKFVSPTINVDTKQKKQVEDKILAKIP